MGGLITEPQPSTQASVGRDRVDRTGAGIPGRRELFMLAAVLAATVVTGAAAIAGLTRKAAPVRPSMPTVSQVVGQGPASPPRVEPGG